MALRVEVKQYNVDKRAEQIVDETTGELTGQTRTVYDITLRLRLIDVSKPTVVLERHFQETWDPTVTGGKADALAAFQAKMQAAIDEYKAEQAMLESTDMSDGVSILESQLVV